MLNFFTHHTAQYCKLHCTLLNLTLNSTRHHIWFHDTKYIPLHCISPSLALHFTLTFILHTEPGYELYCISVCITFHFIEHYIISMAFTMDSIDIHILLHYNLHWTSSYTIAYSNVLHISTLMKCNVEFFEIKCNVWSATWRVMKKYVIYDLNTSI